MSTETPIKSAHALILNRLAEMQRGTYYAVARDELKMAEETIVSLERELTTIRDELKRRDAQIATLKIIAASEQELLVRISELEETNRLGSEGFESLKADYRALQGELTAGRVEAERCHLRVRGELSESCPFCNAIGGTGRNQECPMCGLCQSESERDTLRAALATAERERDEGKREANFMGNAASVTQEQCAARVTELTEQRNFQLNAKHAALDRVDELTKERDDKDSLYRNYAERLVMAERERDAYREAKDNYLKRGDEWRCKFIAMRAERDSARATVDRMREWIEATAAVEITLNDGRVLKKADILAK